MKSVSEFWTDKTSVFFTSFWGWSPETWGTVGFSGERGRTRRTNLLQRLSDPFICVSYVTSNQTYADPELKGMIAGFYLASHETGDRDEFTHPIHHNLDADKWRHSLRALRAFTYLPEHRLRVSDLDPTLLNRARSVSAMGEIITDQEKIELLRQTPWIEVEVYTSSDPQHVSIGEAPAKGLVPAGPASKAPYVVSTSTYHLPRELYVLRLAGDTDAYLGRSSDGRSIYKVGLSVSPDMRRQSFQKSMPRGAFNWHIDRTTVGAGMEPFKSFNEAVAGETAMKKYLAMNAEWLGGEFYLASNADIDVAWEVGHLPEGAANLKGTT